MPNYIYKVRDKHGRALSGVIEGADEKAAIDSLRKMGYTPINIEMQKHRILTGPNLFSRVRDEDLVLFTRQMYTVLKAGIPLLAGLETVGEQTGSRGLKEAAARMRTEIEGGMSFSEALSKNPRIFPSLYVSMVKAGEASGLLDEVMRRLAEFGEYEMDIKARIKAATRYPILAFATLIAAFFVVVTFVIPRFAAIFGQFQVQLPLPTRILLGTYKVIHDYWLIAAILSVAIIIFFIRFINTPFGRARWDMLKLKSPIFGKLFFRLSMSRFAKTASTLIASGINMLQTLDLTADTVGNVVIARAIRHIKDGVNEGKGLAEPMKVSRLFTPMVIQMVAIGEETGKLDELLAGVCEHYDQELNYMVKNLTTVIEPVFILALALMVLLLALGIFLPMWNLIQIFKA